MTDYFGIISKWVRDRDLVMSGYAVTDLAGRLQARERLEEDRCVVAEDEACCNCFRFPITSACKFYARCKGAGTYGEFRWSERKREEWKEWLRANTGSTVLVAARWYVPARKNGSSAPLSAASTIGG